MRRALIGMEVLLALGGVARAAACPVLPPYDGPIFDANVQAWSPNVEGLPEALSGTGVKRAALFANSRAGTSATTNAVLALARAHPDRSVPGAPKIGFIQGGDLPGEFVADSIAGVADGIYKRVGEILLGWRSAPATFLPGSEPT